ncbi:MAG: hypothetical protein IJP43_04745 [Oscillospiraceae bacterium]|nr:hypothetical protein [Oscillospiraceae bacterium]
MSFRWSLSKNGEPIDSATFTVSEDSTLFQIVMPAAAINGANFFSLNEALEAAKSVENAALTLKDDVSCSDIDLTC